MVARYLRIAGLGVGLLGYFWYSAVRNTTAVKDKKADRREATLRLRG